MSQMTKLRIVLALLVAGSVASIAAPRADALFCCSFIRRAVDKVGNTVRRAVNTVGRGISDAARKAKELAEAAARKAREVAEAAARVAKTAAEKAAQAAKWAAEKAAEAAKAVLEAGKKLAQLLAKVGELTKKLAEFTTGQIVEVISAAKEGPLGLLKWVANKMPPPIGKVVNALFFEGGSFVDRLKKVGAILLDGLKSLVDGVKRGMQEGIDKVVKPLVAQVTGFIEKSVLGPALEGVAGLVQGEIDDIASQVAGAILGRTEGLQARIGSLAGAIEGVANGDMSAVNSQLAAYNTSIDTVGQDVVNMALEYGLGWVRGKAVTFVMKNVHKLMDQVWRWAYTGVSAARNAVQGAVGSIPFAGGVLAAAVGFLIDQAWDLLKGKVDEFLEEQVNKFAEFAMSKAKEALSGPAARAGGFLQKLVDGLRGPLQIVAQKVKALTDPILSKYRAVVAKLQAIRDKGAPPAAPEQPAKEPAPPDTPPPPTEQPPPITDTPPPADTPPPPDKPAPADNPPAPDTPPPPDNSPPDADADKDADPPPPDADKDKDKDKDPPPPGAALGAPRERERRPQ
jgi:hypothetical protein